MPDEFGSGSAGFKNYHPNFSSNFYFWRIRYVRHFRLRIRKFFCVENIVPAFNTDGEFVAPVTRMKGIHSSRVAKVNINLFPSLSGGFRCNRKMFNIPKNFIKNLKSMIFRKSENPDRAVSANMSVFIHRYAFGNYFTTPLGDFDFDSLADFNLLRAVQFVIQPHKIPLFKDQSEDSKFVLLDADISPAAIYNLMN